MKHLATLLLLSSLVSCTTGPQPASPNAVSAIVNVATGRFATCGLDALPKSGRLVGSIRLSKPTAEPPWLPFASIELKAESEIMVLRLSLSQREDQSLPIASFQFFPFDRDHNVREALPSPITDHELPFVFEWDSSGTLSVQTGAAPVRTYALQSPIKEGNFRISSALAELRLTTGGGIYCPPDLVQ